MAASEGASLYDVLGVAPSATAEEIRAAYRAKALASHPDKDAMGGGRDAGSFRRVQEAWETLGVPQKRMEYDRRQRASEAACAVTWHDELPLEAMDVDEGEDGQREFSYPCRCGDFFEISGVEIESITKSWTSGAVVVPCRTCSLHIRVLLPESCTAETGA